MDLYDVSIPVISSLQHKLAEHADLMRLVSVTFDPKYAFLVCAPIAYLLDQRVGRKLILAVVLAEWLNQILKWLLHGERPYWYVHSSGRLDPQLTPIRQFPVTCELGPGQPSGHAMVTASVWFIILESLLELYTASRSASDQPARPDRPDDRPDDQPDDAARAQLAPASHRQAQYTTWTLYLLLLVTVSVSRVFLGCHFPHQCLAGALLGFLLAKWVASLDTRSGWLFVGVAPALLLSAFGVFGLMQALGLDPSWTLKLATKHCAKREYIHLDTAPFFSIMRYCGFCLGTGLGLLLPLKRYLNQSLLASLHLSPADALALDSASDKLHVSGSRLVSWFSVKILSALLMARLVDNLGLFVSHANLLLYYSSALLGYTMFAFAFVSL